MAHIKKYGENWRAEVCVDLKRRAKTFSTKREAVAWANEQEQDGILAHHTLRDALKKYLPIAEKHKGYKSELSRLGTLEEMACIDTPLEYLTPAMMSAWRDSRLLQVSPVSVRREMIILGAIFRVAIREWGWLRSSPLTGVSRPKTSAPRRRGIKVTEIDGISAKLMGMRVGAQVDSMFLLSIETGMRLGELLALRWGDVGEKTVVLRDTKNGDARIVPLSQRARDIIATRRGIDPNAVFTLTQHVASQTFRRARDAAGFHDVHFHDARSEAVTRLSKRVDVMQLARIIGHRDIKSLMIYYAESADDIADRL